MPYLSVNNVKLHYQIHGEGEPLLFIHGLGSSIQDWENQITYFSPSFKVITLDLRGHGKSDKPNMPYSVPLFARDVMQLIERLQLSKVHIVGHSLGGMIAFQLALDDSPHIQTLTVVNSAPEVVFPSFKVYFNFQLRHWIVKCFGVKLLSKMMAHKLFPEPSQEGLCEKFIQRWSQNDSKAYLNALKAFSGWSVMDRLHELNCPTLIITADQDYTSVSSKEAYARNIKFSEVVVIEKSHHMTIIDRPLPFNQALWNFLKRNEITPG